MSDGEVRKVTVQDIQMVQNLIERCLQLYMNQREVVSTLSQQAKIEPGFTELVWQKLETENQEFFSAYYLRLILKDQISRFNQLLERQAELMHQICPTGDASSPLSSGSQNHPTHNNFVYQASHPAGPSTKPENIDQASRGIFNVYTNDASSMQPCMPAAVNMGVLADRIDVPENILLAQSSNTTVMQGIAAGGMIKSEGGHTDYCPSIFFGADNNLSGPHNTNAEASISPCTSANSSSRAFNEPVMEPDMNSFGFLGQIIRNFSLSDLTDDFSNSIDILENYSRSPFVGTDANLLDPQIGGEQPQDIRRLDADQRT